MGEDAKDIRQELKAALGEDLKRLRDSRIFVEATDAALVFEAFTLLKTSDYFNKKAAQARRPEDGKTPSPAAAFQDAARAVMAGGGWKAEREMERAWDALGSERNEIMRYALARTDEFIAGQPAMWKRMEDHLPKFVAKLKQLRA